MYVRAKGHQLFCWCVYAYVPPRCPRSLLLLPDGAVVAAARLWKAISICLGSVPFLNYCISLLYKSTTAVQCTLSRFNKSNRAHKEQNFNAITNRVYGCVSGLRLCKQWTSAETGLSAREQYSLACFYKVLASRYSSLAKAWREQNYILFKFSMKIIYFQAKHNKSGKVLHNSDLWIHYLFDIYWD